MGSFGAARRTGRWQWRLSLRGSSPRHLLPPSSEWGEATVASIRRGGERVSRGVTCIVLGAHARLIRATRRAGRRQGRPGVRGACSRLRLRASGARTTSHRTHRQSPHQVKVCRVASRGCLVHEHGSSGPFARRAGGRDGSLHRLGSEASAPSEWGEQKFSSRLQGPFRGSVDCDPGVAYVA